MTEIQPSNYWLSSTALHVTLNAMGLADYIQMNVSTGSVFACYLSTVSDLGFDAGHNYKRWPLSASPTYFNSTSAKYVYVAVPRGGDTSKDAIIVFPSEHIDVYGKNEAGTQVGSVEYYYVWLQAIITSSIDSNGVKVDRAWNKNTEPNCGSLATEESFVKGGESTWWQWNSIGDTITFLKEIAKATFNTISIGSGNTKRTINKIFNSTDGDSLSAEKEEASKQDDGIVTPGYVNIFGNTHYVRKDADDIVQGNITFKKNISVEEDVTINGNNVVKGNSKVSGDSETGGKSVVTGDENIGGNQTVSGTQSIGGDSELQNAIFKKLLQIIDGAIGQTGFADSIITGVGKGWNIDKYGNAQMESLMLRTFLEVPEIRFNRTTYIQGDNIQSRAGGQIKEVIIDKDDSGKELQTGTIILKLEDNDVGEFASDDLCISIYCNLLDKSQNSTLTSDDGMGNRTIKGFSTSMFRITSVSGDKNEKLTYVLRGTSERWLTLFHPQALASMAQRGNISDKTRQQVAIRGICPEIYTRFMHDVNDWEFTNTMIGCQFGYLENLKGLGIDMTGYSAYLDNIYMSGVIQQFEAIKPYMVIDKSLDSMSPGQTDNITCTVYDGYNRDITSQYSRFYVTRESGDDASDSVWNAEHTNTTNKFSISFSDLGINSSSQVSTKFTAYAVDADGTSAESATTSYNS